MGATLLPLAMQHPDAGFGGTDARFGGIAASAVQIATARDHAERLGITTNVEFLRVDLCDVDLDPLSDDSECRVTEFTQHRVN